MLTRSVILIGLMGSGKTTVGKRLAKKIGCDFVDTDDVVSQQAGIPVREIFKRDGEAAFRRHESAALNEILSSKAHRIVAAAGGVVLAEKNRAAIAAAGVYVVWLHAETPELLKRVGAGTHRPLLDGDAPATLEAMSITREKFYSELANKKFETNGLTVSAVAAHLLTDLVEKSIVVETRVASVSE